MSKDLVDILAHKAERFPDKPFIIFGRKKISFRQVDKFSSLLASFLAQLGIVKGERICIWMYNCPEFVISYFAILKAGAVVVPINNMFKREEAKYVVEDSESKIMFCSSEKIEDGLNIQLRTKEFKKVISFSFNKAQYLRVLDLYTILRAQENVTKDIEINSDDLAEILYTSGTTGKPKGACLTHNNLISNVIDCARVTRAKPKDTFICVLPLFHSFASTVCMLFPLYVGSSTVIFRQIRPFKRILRSIRKNKVTIFTGVPSLFGVLTEIKLPAILRSPLIKLFNPLRMCISGAAALPKEILPVFERKFRVPLLEGYGLTEASPVVSLNPLKGIRKPGSIGLPLPSVKVKIVDKEGNQLGYNRVGELLVKGPNVMQGYFKREEESKKIIANQFLHTGDLAKIDEDGYIYIEGRIKEMINVRGLNVYPREIEEVLYQLPFVKEAAVVGIQHPRKGEVPMGYVVVKEKKQAQPSDIIRFLRQRLAGFKVPHRIEIRDFLPKNTTGKILKYQLKQETEKTLFSKKEE